MCRLPARALMGSNRRGADEQVASRGPMGSDGRSTNEVLLTGAHREATGSKGSNCEQRKNLLARKHTANKESTCWQGNTLRARVAPAEKKAPAGKETHCRQRYVEAPAARRADEMEFIVRSQREP